MDNVKTKAIVLRRTNYGEADRILNILTPMGKMSVMAKGVRKTQSKLAGGIELFCVSDVVVHRGKGDLGVLTSARLVEFYSEIMKDLAAMEFMGGVMKEMSRRAEGVDVPEYFDLVWQVLAGVDGILKTGEKSAKLPVVMAWWGLNVVRASGEEMNLRTDVLGDKLVENKKYGWDGQAQALKEYERGEISAEHIKLMRLMVSSPLKLVLNVKGAEKLVNELSYVVKAVNRN
ncbi:DNA repair protein RecO [Candidatus Saccharibacteria bacterium]|nr:DNA repair protein RecO [Candidatus Saccharibacteria bacterium]